MSENPENFDVAKIGKGWVVTSAISAIQPQGSVTLILTLGSTDQFFHFENSEERDNAMYHLLTSCMSLPIKRDREIQLLTSIAESLSKIAGVHGEISEDEKDRINLGLMAREDDARR